MKNIIKISSAVISIVIVIVAAVYIFMRPAAPFSPSEVIYDEIELDSPLYPSIPGVDVKENKYAVLDYSNISQGYVAVSCKTDMGREPVMKIICGDSEYTYMLGDSENTYPLTCGDGEYTFKIYRSIDENRYTAVMTKTLPIVLENQLLPYLYPSHLVNYTRDSAAVAKAEEMCRDTADNLEKLKRIYDFITENIEYDYTKAANIEKGYIPSVDSTYISKTGICYDYSVIMAAMLRTQNIPVKLVTGYLNGTSVFHAWNEVYLKNSGWVTLNIPINAKTFRMLDTTLASSQTDSDVAKKLDDPLVYAPVYKY